MENKISKQKKVSRQKAAAAIARIIEAAQIVTNYEQQYCNKGETSTEGQAKKGGNND